MNVVRCCCISYNQLFQASFVATLFRTCRSFPNNVQPSRKRPHRGFQNPEVLPSKLQRNPAIPKFVSEPPELYHGRPQTSNLYTSTETRQVWRLRKDKLLSVISPGNRKSWTVFETWVATYGKRSTFWKNSSIFFGEASMCLLECSKVMHFVNFTFRSTWNHPKKREISQTPWYFIYMVVKSSMIWYHMIW